MIERRHDRQAARREAYQRLVNAAKRVGLPLERLARAITGAGMGLLGIDDETAFLEIGEAAWDAVIQTNLKGPFLMSQHAAREMAYRDPVAFGAIVDAIAAVAARQGRPT